MYSKSFKTALIVLSLFSFLSVYSQIAPSQQTQNYTIASIFVTGAEFADPETIITLSGLKVGEEITLPFDKKIQTAIKNLWNRKQFSDVDIVADKITEVGVFLEIKVKEFPRLSYIEIENNKKIDYYDITKAISKTRGDILTNYDKYLASKKVKKLYLDEGYGFAKIDSKIEKTDTASYSRLILDIDEGLEFKVRKISFEGNKNFDDDELYSTFDETKIKQWWQLWRSGKFDKEKYLTDKDLLINYYKKNGFIDARIVSDTVIYDEKNEAVFVNIKLDEGTKFFVRNISFNGNTVYPSDILMRRLEFKSGDVYDVERFQKNLMGNENQTDAYSMYLDNGYLQARITPDLKRVGGDSVDIEIRVFENDRSRIGRVDIVGNIKTKDKVIRRELYTRPGDYFDRSAIIRSLRALQATQYFKPESLKPEPKPSETDNTAVDIIYRVEENSTDTFNAAIGFAGSYGLTVSAGMTFNNFSLTEPLKGGGGQVFNFNYEQGYGNRYNTFTIGLTEPWLFDTPTTLGFNIFDTYFNYSDIEQKRTGVALNIGRRFRWPDDYWRADWGMRVQFNKNSRESYYYRVGEYSEISINQRISRASVNHMFFPSVGSKFSLSTNVALGALGIGQTDYIKNEISYEMFNPLFGVEGMDRLVFMLSAKLGYINGFTNDTLISPIELYRMGGNGLSGYGVTPLRGYLDDKIGEGASKVMAKYTAELRFAIALEPMPIFFYVFAEAGNIWSNLKVTNPFELKRSAGLGVQLFINPIGIIGFSYGYGFDTYRTGGDEPSGWRFLFHLGQF